MNIPSTEAVNPLTKDMDTWPALKIVEAMNAEDHRIASAVARELPAVAKAAQMVANSLRVGGKVFYVGAGTSGRIAVLDASEIEPTFGALGRRFVVLMAGGRDAVFEAVEGAEDDALAGRNALLEAGARSGDTVVGVSSSGRTPYVAGALEAAREIGAGTVALVGDPRGPVASLADVVISPDVGPEVVAGSTRLKNGTAHKMVLNMISTTAMVLLGRTYSNLMAGTSPRNSKLSARAVRLLAEASGESAEEASRALEACRGRIDAALVSLLAGCEPSRAMELLEKTGGAIRAAVQAGSAATGRAVAGTETISSPHRASGPAAFEPVAQPRTSPPAPSAAPPPPPPPIRYGDAAKAGLDPAKVEQAFAVVRDAVGDGEGEIPGAVAAIVHNGILIGPRAFGWAVRDPVRIPMTPRTIFDMASLTKVVATLPSVLIACERGLFRLDDPVSRFIPEFASGNKEGITLRHLLTHTSGLPAHVKFWEMGLKKEEILPFISSLEVPPGAPGQKVVYSDLGFILLGEVLRRVTGLRLDEFASREVFAPLGMAETCFLPPEDKKHLIAATEFRPDLGKWMWGEVHDENAFALGGIAGHAGLFSTAEDIARYALMWLGQGEWGGRRVMSKAAVAAATSEQTSAGERRGLGWLLRSQSFSSGGDFFSVRSFGHTGFTGTSLWCDPETGTAAILLTNRVHAGRQGNAVIRLRPIFANAVAAAVK